MVFGARSPARKSRQSADFPEANAGRVARPPEATPAPMSAPMRTPVTSAERRRNIHNSRCDRRYHTLFGMGKSRNRRETMRGVARRTPPLVNQTSSSVRQPRRTPPLVDQTSSSVRQPRRTRHLVDQTSSSVRRPCAPPRESPSPYSNFSARKSPGSLTPCFTAYSSAAS